MMVHFSPTERRCFWAIVLIALTVRVGAAWYWQDQVQRSGESFRFGDSQSYWIIASNLARGEPYQFGSENSKIFRSPLYPILLAPWTWIGPGNPSSWGVWMARSMGCVLGCGAVACIMWMTRLVASPRVSLIAGILASIYPGAIAMSIFILSEAIATPMFLLSCACVLWGLREPSRGRSAFLAAGLAFGLACLARPSWSLWPLVLFPFVILAAPTRNFRELLPTLRHLGLFCAVAILVMAPWWIRNYRVTGKFVPTTLQVGASLYDGWHPGASGASDEEMEFVVPFLEAQQREDEMLANQGVPLDSTLEWRIDRRLQRAAWDWAWKNPSDAIWLSLVKLVKTWSPLPVAKEVRPLVRWSEALGYTALVVGGLAGAWRLRRESGGWLAWMPCLYLALLHAIFIGSVRYRQPGVLLLCPLAAAGWQSIHEWIRKRGFQSPHRQTDSS
jgi:hypothetical protein